MQEMTMEEVGVVGGGVAEGLPEIAAGSASIRLLMGVGQVWSAFYGGWQAGQWLNENTPIQHWIADGLESFR